MYTMKLSTDNSERQAFRVNRLFNVKSTSTVLSKLVPNSLSSPQHIPPYVECCWEGNNFWASPLLIFNEVNEVNCIDDRIAWESVCCQYVCNLLIRQFELHLRLVAVTIEIVFCNWQAFIEFNSCLRHSLNLLSTHPKWYAKRVDIISHLSIMKRGLLVMIYSTVSHGQEIFGGFQLPFPAVLT